MEILTANTAEGANFELQRHGAMMPAATISLVPIGDSETIWYKVLAGAFTDSSRAAQLLSALRRRHVISDSSGTVVRTPFALLVDSVPSEAAVLSKTHKKIQDYSSRGLAVLLTDATRWERATLHGCVREARAVLTRRVCRANGGLESRTRVPNRNRPVVRLTKLELHGFKSFADETELVFEPGVTATRRWSTTSSP